MSRLFIYVPEINSRTFVFFNYRGTTGVSFSIRDFVHGDGRPRYAKDFPGLTAEKIVEMTRREGSFCVVIDTAHHKHTKGDAGWYRQTLEELNEEHLAGRASRTREPPAAPDPPSTAQPAVFWDSGGRPLPTFEDWRRVHPASHWVPGRSAMLLAQSWSAADGFPAKVRAALDQEERLRGLQIERAIVEHKTPMPGHGQPSQTDIMVFAMQGARSVVVAVEGKVDEGFGPVVGAWRVGGGSPRSEANRAKILRAMCTMLGLRTSRLDKLRYQLIHRAYSAAATAGAHGATAVLVIHSFDERRTGWSDFEAFAVAMGAAGVEPGTPAWAGDLCLVWVHDPRGAASSSARARTE